MNGQHTHPAGPLVEILYFDGCPNHQPAIALVEQISREPVSVAVNAAPIPPERCGAARAGRLSDDEHSFYHWILARFAQATPPDVEAIRECAQRLNLEPAETLAQLAREDLVHADEQGSVVVAYPFSARRRGHRVLIDNSRTVEATCAIDALGIASMLALSIEVTSRGPEHRHGDLGSRLSATSALPQDPVAPATGRSAQGTARAPCPRGTHGSRTGRVH